MKHFLLFYDTVPEYLARAAQGRGDLVLAGALASPVDGAVLLTVVGEGAATPVVG